MGMNICDRERTARAHTHTHFVNVVYLEGGIKKILNGHFINPMVEDCVPSITAHLWHLRFSWWLKIHTVVFWVISIFRVYPEDGGCRFFQNHLPGYVVS
jgi:hypothetical protein